MFFRVKFQDGKIPPNTEIGFYLNEIEASWKVLEICLYDAGVRILVDIWKVILNDSKFKLNLDDAMYS